MIRRVIFDLDNTLIAWKDEYWKALEDVFDLFLIDVSSEELLEIKEKIDHYEDYYNCYNRKSMKSLIEGAFKRKITLPFEFIDVWEENLGHCADEKDEKFKDTLFYLSQKYELVVLTNWFLKSALLRLKKAGILDFFKEVYGGEEVKKPDEKAFLIACGCNKPCECVMIGDNLKTDIEPARRLGLRTIYYKEDSLEECLCIKSICELERIL